MYDAAMRQYQRTHPWITFETIAPDRLGPRTWMLLGEARAACSMLARLPLQPAVAREMYTVALTRGAQATTAIEGNTLTVEQVRGILTGDFTAPPSRAYQEREVRNVLEALQGISEQAQGGSVPQITRALICDYNRQILEGTERPADVVPGSVRRHMVGVGRYAGAPAEDCEYLLERLAGWLNSEAFRSEDPAVQFAGHFLAAVCAHVYIAWIHPFADGNGRTARLLEFTILARSGTLPLLAAHLLSDHYNLTRDRYYQELAASSAQSSVAGFVAYAVEGFVDGLRAKHEQVLEQQLRVTWTNFVQERLADGPATPSRDRRQALVLGMAPGVIHSRTELATLNTPVTALYARVGPKTLSRDLNQLVDMGLVVKEESGWRANVDVLAAFLPPSGTTD